MRSRTSVMSNGFVKKSLAPHARAHCFTAADISVGYALELALNNVGFGFGEVEQAYMRRLREREGYQRALRVCHATRNWWTSQAAGRPATLS